MHEVEHARRRGWAGYRRAGHGRAGHGRARRLLAAVGLAVLASGAVAGCSLSAGTPSPIQIASAYVPVPQSPGTTVAYMVIRNNGPADRLVSARTSVGGTVVFRVPQRPGSATMRTVPALVIPANGTFSMEPAGDHLLITGAGPMPGGKDIILTLTFARAGSQTVVAQVTNAETGGSSYFLN